MSQYLTQFKSVFSKIIFFTLIVFFGCHKNQSDLSDFKFSSLSDTTKLFSSIKFDSSLIKPFKKFVVTNQLKLTDNNYSKDEIDSVFKLEIEKIESFNKLQNLVNLEIEFAEREQFGFDRIFIKLRNTSDRVIDALILKIEYYNTFQEYLGSQKIEITNEINSNTSITKKIVPRTKTGSLIRKEDTIFHKNDTIYVVAYLTKIAISDGETISSKMDSELQDFSNYLYPFYLGIRQNSEVHRVKKSTP